MKSIVSLILLSATSALAQPIQQVWLDDRVAVIPASARAHVDVGTLDAVTVDVVARRCDLELNIRLAEVNAVHVKDYVRLII